VWDILHLPVRPFLPNNTPPVRGPPYRATPAAGADAVYIGAVAVGGTLFNTMYWLFNFLRMGTGGLAAQAFGSGKGRDIVLLRSLALALGFGILLIVLGGFTGQYALGFMDADDATARLASRYFDILIWGAPAVLATYVAMGWLVGMQDTRSTMIIAIATNVINIAVSATLVFGAGWKIEGVASGTLVAQWSGAAIAAVVIVRKFSPQLQPVVELIRVSELKRFFRINSDMFLRTACLVAVTLWFTHSGARAGADILAANALLLQLFMLFSFFMDGFAYAAEAISGKYEGAGLRDMVVALERTLMRIGLCFAIGFAILYFFAGETIMRILTDDVDVVVIGRRYLLWAVAMPLCGFMAFVYDGVLVGLTRTRVMLVAMACAMVSFFALYFCVRSSLGNDGLWLAFDVYLFVRGAVECMAMRKYADRKNQ
ncbi:MAG: MATE family efflux transporter, partial [Muribaculaceae bacterium]|nr:MATE family efflux transporter [Muribaculaceae bacterium]